MKAKPVAFNKYEDKAMRCKTARRMIDLSLGSELGHNSLLAQHLELCPKCRARFTQNQKLDQMLSVELPTEFPSWIHNRIMDSVRSHDPIRKSLKRRWNLQAVPATMAVMLSLYVGILVGVKTFTPEQELTTQEIEYVTYGENSLIAFDTTNGGYHE